MTFKIPTLDEQVESVRQSFRTNLPGSDAWLWPNNVNPAAKVIGAAVYANNLFLQRILRQAFVATAEGKFLDLHGKQYGIIRHPPSIAQGKITLAGTPGLVVADYSVFSKGDGVEYETLIDVTLDANGNGVADVRSKLPGRGQNALPGTQLTGISDAMVHTDGIGLGADEEDDEPYRSRILFHLQHPPHGGAAHDYIEWTRQINGVTRVFVDPHPAAGKVDVWFLMTDLYPNGIPQAADVAVAQAHIEKVRPVTAIVTQHAPLAMPIDIEITGLYPDTPNVRSAIEAEIADLFDREMRVSTQLEPFTLRRSKIWEAIGQAVGEDHHTLSTPLTDLGIITGSYPVPGIISYV